MIVIDAKWVNRLPPEDRHRVQKWIVYEGIPMKHCLSVTIDDEGSMTVVLLSLNKMGRRFIGSDGDVAKETFVKRNRNPLPELVHSEYVVSDGQRAQRKDIK